MKKKAINQPERYEAPRVKVKMLRRRASLLAASLTLGGDTENENGDTTESYGEDNGAW